MSGFGPEFNRWAADPNSRLAITGATGWIGLALTHEAVDCGFTPENGRLRLFGSSSRSLDIEGSPMPIEALFEARGLGNGDWLVAHFAFLGKERTEDLSPSAFIEINETILHEAQRLAGSAAHARFLFASSGAAHFGSQTATGSASDLYGQMKRQHEAGLEEWCAARTMPLAICRVFNIGGPLINKRSRYALSSIIEAVLDHGKMEIAAPHPVFRSYVHVRELVTVMAEAALDPAATTAPFDTCGREIVELEDLARIAAKVVGIDANVRRAKAASGAADWYCGDGRVYRQILSNMGRDIVPLHRIIADTATWLKTVRPSR